MNGQTWDANLFTSTRSSSAVTLGHAAGKHQVLAKGPALADAVVHRALGRSFDLREWNILRYSSWELHHEQAQRGKGQTVQVLMSHRSAASRSASGSSVYPYCESRPAMYSLSEML